MADAAERGAEPDKREAKRSSRLIIGHGGVEQFAHSFSSSEAVIPAYIQLLTGSSVYVGLSRAMMRVGWAWPQILISNLIEGRERKQPVFLLAGLIQCSVTISIGVGTWVLADESPGASRPILYPLRAQHVDDGHQECALDGRDGEGHSIRGPGAGFCTTQVGWWWAGDWERRGHLLSA